MLLKITGSLIVFMACSVAGFIMADECSRRPRELRDLQNLLAAFENEVRYMSNPLVEAFARIAEKSNSPVTVFFSETAGFLKSETGKNAYEAWNGALERHGKKTALNRDDMDILQTFGTMLGNSDIEGQLGSIQMTAGQLRMQEREAESRRQKSEAMYKRMGLLIGLAIVIVLF